MSEHIGILRYVKDAVAFAKALADLARLRIIAALRKRELCVCELSDALEIKQSTLSTHLMLLRAAGLVQTRRDGRWIYYRLNADVQSLTDGIFDRFSNMTQDKRLCRDTQRIQRRLKLRDNGCCNLGFNELD